MKVGAILNHQILNHQLFSHTVVIIQLHDGSSQLIDFTRCLLLDFQWSLKEFKAATSNAFSEYPANMNYCLGPAFSDVAAGF